MMDIHLNVKCVVAFDSEVAAAEINDEIGATVDHSPHMPVVSRVKTFFRIENCVTITAQKKT
jgi:phage tail sheath gpL-like